MDYVNPARKQLYIICLLCLCVLISGCSAAEKEYIAEIECITGRVESKQLRIIWGVDSLVAQFTGDPLVVDVFSYPILGNLNQIENTISNIDRISDDTSDLIAMMNKLSAPYKFKKYHAYYLNVLEKYKGALEDKHDFYSETRYEACSIMESLSDGNLYAQMKSLELENDNQQHNYKISAALRELRSATDEFKALLDMNK
ncbi:MAG: hypothetical protein GX881_01255 [Firmicutes bacterium]|nr:hypothetical protein [Bacillota bacterium]